jgi:hypothetical protein
VGWRELFFGNSGITSSDTCLSHHNNPDIEMIDMGITQFSHLDVVRVMRKHFMPGTYDIVLKNCNSFTDCALYMMCEQRLAWHFRGLDTFVRQVDGRGFFRSLLPAKYHPNPLCADWQLEHVLGQIDVELPSRVSVSDLDADGYVVYDLDGGRSSDGETPEPSSVGFDFKKILDMLDIEIDESRAHFQYEDGEWSKIFDLDAAVPKEQRGEDNADFRLTAPAFDLRVTNRLSCKSSTGYQKPLQGDVDGGSQFDGSMFDDSDSCFSSELL